VFVDNGAALIMNNGAILQNNTAHSGGGVSVGNGSRFIMNGGKISGNTSDIGGGVFMRHGAEFNMNGGTISGNVANDFGGGVFVNDASRFTMNGGKIDGNTANAVGGGVNVWGGEFTMTAGSICGNIAVDGDCVFVYDGAVFNNENGSICDITANGGIFVADKDSVGINDKDNDKPAAASPVSLFTAGPNPVSKSSGMVNFFVGAPLAGARDASGARNAPFGNTPTVRGTLKIYDASGKVINNVRISDKAITGNGTKRAVGSWNLRDTKGRLVSEGTYLVKGTIIVNGKKEMVSVTLGVR